MKCPAPHHHLKTSRKRLRWTWAGLGLVALHLLTHEIPILVVLLGGTCHLGGH